MKKQDTSLTGADRRDSSVKKLPSGFGTVRYLGKERRNPYAVHPPAADGKKVQPGKGLCRRPPALCYVCSRETGIKVLVLYHAGLYVSGLENDPVLLDQLYNKIISQVYGLELKEGMFPSLKVLSQLKRCLERYADRGALPGSLSDVGMLSADHGRLPADSGKSLPDIGTLSADYGRLPADSDRFPTNPDRLPAGVGILSGNQGRFPAGSCRPPAGTGPARQTAGNPGADGGGLQMPFRTGQPESASELYVRLHHLQACIKSLMEDISRITSGQGDSVAPPNISWNNAHDISERTVSEHAVSECSVSEYDISESVFSDDVFDIVPGTSMGSAPPGTDCMTPISAAGIAPFTAAGTPSLSTAGTPTLTADSTPPLTAAGVPTLSAVYTAFHDFKYGPHAARQLSRSSRNVTAAAYRKLARFYDRSLDEISVMEWQELVNETAASGNSRSAVADLVTLIRQLYRFALPRDMCTREYGNYIVMPYTSEESHHQDFTDAELIILWQHKDDPVVAMILIMCYSGFRIGEFERLKVFLDQDGRTGYFCGGLKTKAGRNRIVPIHSAIMPLLRQILDDKGQPVFFCGKSSRRFREIMKQTLVRLGIDTVPERESGGVSPGAAGILPGSPPTSRIYRKPHGEYRYHTPHSSRHTFSRLCESYGVNEADRRRMLGHSFGNDITNGVYGHRSVEELRTQIEKIKLPQE